MHMYISLVVWQAGIAVLLWQNHSKPSTMQLLGDCLAMADAIVLWFIRPNSSYITEYKVLYRRCCCVSVGQSLLPITSSCWEKILHRRLLDRTFPKFGNSVARKMLYVFFVWCWVFCLALVLILCSLLAGSWYHCLPIGIYHWLGEEGCIAVVCEVLCYTEVRPGLTGKKMRWHFSKQRWEWSDAC